MQDVALDIQMMQLMLHQSAITFKMMETLNRRHLFHAGKQRNYYRALWEMKGATQPK